VVAIFFCQHLTYPYLLDRHRLLGPWTRASVVLHFSYVAVNVFLISFRSTSVDDAGRRAGTLSLINLTFLLSALHLSYLADLLGVPLRICRQIHRAAGWMTAALIAFHVVIAVLLQRVDFSLHEAQNVSTVIVRSYSTMQRPELTVDRVLRLWDFFFFFVSHYFAACRTRSSFERTRP
jgi:hypothetical protein